MNPAKRRIEILHHLAERGGERGPPADQHIVMAGAQLARPGAAESLTISRNRRRTRLRSTASPTCRDTVNPTRIAPSSARRRACTTKARPEARAPFAAARKSLRRFSRSTTAERAPRSRTEPLAPARAPRRDHLTAALGRHARAKTVPALAHQFARLVGSFHGIFSAARKTRIRLQRSRSDTEIQRGRTIGAAYTGPLPARQCDATRAPTTAFQPRVQNLYDRTETPAPEFPLHARR